MPSPMIVESYGADQWDENSMSGLSVQHMDTVPTPQRGGLFERLAGGVGGGVGGVGPAWMAALQERGQHSTARQSPRYAFDHHHYPASASRTPSHQATPHREQTPLSYGTAPSSGLAVTPLFQPGTEKISVVRAVATSGVGGIEFVLPKVADTSRYVVVPSVVRVSKEVITEIAGTDLFSEVSTKCKVVFTSRVCPAQSEKVITVSNPRVCPDEVYDIWLVSPDPYSLSHKVALPPDIASPTVMLPHAQPPRVFSPLQELDVNVHPIPQVSPLKAPDIGHHIAPLFERKLRTLSPTRDAIHHKQYAEIATSPIPMQREDAYQSGLYEALPVPLVPLLHPADTQLQPPLIRNDVMVERHPPSRHALDRLCMKKGPFAVEEREAKVITTPMVGATSHKSSAVASLPVTPVASAAPIPEAPLVCTSTVSSTIPRRASFSRTRRRGSRRGSGVSQSEGKSESSAPPPPPPPPAAIQGVLGPRRGSSRSSGRRAFPAIPYVDSELGDEELGEGGGGGVGVVREGVLEQMLAEVPSHMSCREQMEPMVGGAFLHTEYIQQLLFAGEVLHCGAASVAAVLSVLVVASEVQYDVYMSRPLISPSRLTARTHSFPTLTAQRQISPARMRGKGITFSSPLVESVMCLEELRSKSPARLTHFPTEGSTAPPRSASTSTSAAAAAAVPMSADEAKNLVQWHLGVGKRIEDLL